MLKSQKQNVLKHLVSSIGMAILISVNANVTSQLLVQALLSSDVFRQYCALVG